MTENPTKGVFVSYRLHPREPVVEGEWYHTLTCKGCGQPIYPLSDASAGSAPIKIIGDATLLVPCAKCLHDGSYKFSELRREQAKESQDCFRPPRVPISKASRTPLFPQFKDVKPIMGVGLIEDRPKAAAIVGRIITAWADIEVQCARLLAR